MELMSSALTGAFRVGLQVIIARKRPVIEIYSNLNNNFGPPMKVEHKSSDGSRVLRTDEHRFQDIFIDLVMINIGGVRAEDVTFEISGDFKRERIGDDLPELFSTVIHQSSPGQVHYLMRIDQFDLHSRVQDAEDPNASRSGPIKRETLNIVVNYNGPKSLMNWIARIPRKALGKKQYSTTFIFNPISFLGDLPSPKYA